ncbi:peroxiredoxin family protein [Bacillus daqingensis]|uniref:Peroxiredoxin family protein n=1 Tax=Bacillus daqingensis TaxID=872396 RepID=A0ABV9NVV4_9BACI
MENLLVGYHTPDIVLPAVTGDTYQLEKDKEERPGWRLIYYFRGSWCPACEKSLKELKESQKQLSDQNVWITAVSSDRLEKLEGFQHKHNYPFPVLADENMQMLQDYGVYKHDDENSMYSDHGIHGEPAVFLLDEENRLLFVQRQSGPFGRIDMEGLQQNIDYISEHKQ